MNQVSENARAYFQLMLELASEDNIKARRLLAKCLENGITKT